MSNGNSNGAKATKPLVNLDELLAQVPSSGAEGLKALATYINFLNEEVIALKEEITRLNQKSSK